MKEYELKEKLTKLLQELDTSSAPISEEGIFLDIKALINADTGAEPPLQFKAEYMAFAFCESYPDSSTGWGTYFGPLAVLPNDNGTVTEMPSIKQISKEIIEYWACRAKECRHPLLKARYCGLLWDFCKHVTGDPPPHTVGREYIENLLLVAKNDLHKHPTSTIEKLGRALSVAMSLNCGDLVNECKDTILQYEARVVGNFGFSFDLLLCNKNLKLSETEESVIIGNLESWLEGLSNHAGDVKPDPWTSEYAAKRLATYYRARNKTDDVRRVLKKLELAILYIAEQAAPLLVDSFFKQLHSIYIDFGLYDEAESVAVKIRELGSDINKDMKKISHKFEINSEEFDRYVEATTEGELEEAIARIARDYIPIQNKVKCQLEEFARKLPLQFLFNRQITDHKGRTVATIGSLEDDPEGNIIHQIAQDMNLSSLFLDAVMIRLVEKHKLDAEKLTDYIYQCPIFLDEKKCIINLGIASYLEGNHIAATHLLVPQIEDAIRGLFEIQGGAVLKRGRRGSFMLATLDELLRDDIVIQSLGEDMAVYLRVLLTDQRWWNLRNDVCHGILTAEAFCKQKNDRILHAYFCLSTVREKQDEE